MCGEHPGHADEQAQPLGSSPHVRGALLAVLLDLRVVGIIPACAGSTQRPMRSRTARWDHPRMCGEHFGQHRLHARLQGSSPHVRGARLPPQSYRPPTGIIPACAGSTYRLQSNRQENRDHPRMCGEHFLDGLTDMAKKGSSPHVRGALNE